MSIFRIFFSLVMSYLMAAPLTERISLNFAETDWSNAATYAIWVFAPFLWIGIIVCIVGSLCGIAYVGASIIDAKNAKARMASMRDRAANLARSIN